MTKSEAQRLRLSANYIGSAVPNEVAHPLLIERLKSKTVVNERGCWVWMAFRNKGGKGYGYATYKGKNEHAHRAMYRAARSNGIIPEGWDICHTCDDPACINPLHLFAAPRAINVQDMRAKGRGNNQKKTECPKGHPYSAENTYVDPRGFRLCKECNRIRCRKAWADGRAVIRQRRWRARKKQESLQMGKT